ncbi:S-adenosyl-L-methionine-dependent methyltransferase [Phlegmacium glaucopus]|nr:S-adenosyl-L-methionine-dependent methyltransferase [Phlegmacium glaucopus]
MIPTPDISHLTKKDYDEIYEPAEDTFLLLDGLEADAEALKDLRATVCLEIGSGSGCVTSFIKKILGPSVLYLCTDINPHACRCTWLTGEQNQVDIQVVNASLADPFYQRLSYKVDVILFNPPYVPTSAEEVLQAQDSRDIQGSWAGGSDGMQVTYAFLDRAESLLSSRGRFYLVALKQNNIPKICQIMQESYHLQGNIVLQRRAGREHLFIICFVRSPT